MRKLFLLLLILLLAACGATDELTTAVEEAPDVADEAVTSEEAPASADDVDFEIATTAEAAGVARPRDWTKGTDDPLVTVIEYGDFQ